MEPRTYEDRDTSGVVERRVAKDGNAYSREEFLHFYGREAWEWQWNDSPIEDNPQGDLEEASTWTGASSGDSDSHDERNREAVCAECGAESSCLEGKGKFTKTSYCDDCWSSWCESVIAVPRTLPEPGELPEDYVLETTSRISSHRGHYDFIEVGTSDWCTISQFCDGDTERGSWLAEEIRTSLEDLRDARGLAVEAVGEHLAALPRLPRVAQVEAALGEFSGEAVLYYVSADNISKHMGEFYANLHTEVDVMWYAKSMSSVGKPHPELYHLLRSINRLDFLEERAIKVLSWSDLCNLHGVESVDVVQLDCEGMDCSVLRGLLKHCAEQPSAFPRLITFEANWLTDPAEVEETLSALCEAGYRLRSRSWENITVERG